MDNELVTNNETTGNIVFFTIQGHGESLVGSQALWF